MLLLVYHNVTSFMFHKGLILLLSTFFFIAANATGTSCSVDKKASFTFFSENISVRYQEGLFNSDSQTLNDNFISNLIHHKNLSKLDETIEDLEEYKRKYKLTDWLFYLMIRDCSEVIYNGDNEHFQQVLFCWLILGRMDYKVQLNLVQDKAFISVFTLEKIYEFPVKRYGIGWLVEITGNGNKLFQESFTASMRANHFMHTGSRIFSFKLDKLPHLPSRQLVTKTVDFEHKLKKYEIEFSVNSTLVRMIDTYPDMKISNYLNFPLSIEAYNSLIPSLKELIKEKTEIEQLRLLLSFTRQAFKYGHDQDHYERINVIFSPEQTLLHEFSDCEDKSVLFCYIVKELLNKEVILVQYEDNINDNNTNHIAVGVLLDDCIGIPIRHDKKHYTFCDPTGPSDELDIGEYPRDLIGETHSVVD